MKKILLVLLMVCVTFATTGMFTNQGATSSQHVAMTAASWEKASKEYENDILFDRIKELTQQVTDLEHEIDGLEAAAEPKVVYDVIPAVASLSGLAKPGKLKCAQISKMLAKDLGLSKTATIAVATNIWFESMCKAHVRNSIGAIGYAQWYKARATLLRKYAKQRGISWKTDEANYGFLKVDIKHHWSRGTSFAKFKTITSPKQAVLYMCNYWERPGRSHCAKRGRSTNKFVRMFSGKKAVTISKRSTKRKYKKRRRYKKRKIYRVAKNDPNSLFNL